MRDAVAWDAVHVWWGDDRYVPREHPLSNVKPLDDVLLGHGTGGGHPGVPLPIDNIHPFPTSEAIRLARGAGWCAAALAVELRAASLDQADGWPVFDLLLLGVGGDGHLFSVFPDSRAFDSSDLALAIPAPTHIEPRIERVTLNPAVIAVARTVLIVAYGADKAAVISLIHGGGFDPRRWPAQLARRRGTTWILDAAAAAGLRP